MRASDSPENFRGRRSLSLIYIGRAQLGPLSKPLRNKRFYFFCVMEKSFVYILYSKKLDRFYTGVTTLHLEERLENHLQKRYGKLNFTQKASDWTLFWSLECTSFKQSRNIEFHIKKKKSKVYISDFGFLFCTLLTEIYLEIYHLCTAEKNI